MKPKINYIKLESGDDTTNVRPMDSYHPKVSFVRGIDWSRKEDIYESENEKTFYHVTPASMIRAFLALMKLAERRANHV